MQLDYHRHVPFETLLGSLLEEWIRQTVRNLGHLSRTESEQELREHLGFVERRKGAILRSANVMKFVSPK